MKKVLTSLAMVLLIVLAVPTLPAKAAAKLNQTVVQTYIGSQTTIHMEGTNRHVTWSTSNKRVATVKNGKITAKKQGDAVVTAKVGSKKYTCKVTVKDIALSKSKATVTAGKNLKLTLKGANHKVYWTTSNRKVATVKNGRVYAKAAGKATIKAKCNGKTYTCKVTVKKAAEKTVVIKLDKNVLDDQEMMKTTYSYLNKLVIKSKKTRGNTVYCTVTKKSYDATLKELKRLLNEVNTSIVKRYNAVSKITYNNDCTRVKIYVDMRKVRSLRALESDLVDESMAVITQMEYYQAFKGIPLEKMQNHISIYNARTGRLVSNLF